MKYSVKIKLKYIVDIYGRIGFRGYSEDDLVNEGEGAITLSPSNIQNMRMTYKKCAYLTWQKYNESPEIQINNGDILFVKTGSTYGKAGYVENLPMEATINPQLAVFKNIKMNSKLLFYILQTSLVQDQCKLAVTGGTIPTMSQAKINNFEIPFPPLEKQQKIAEYLDYKCRQVDGLIANQQTQIEKLKQYKQSVITEAVTRGLNPSAPLKASGIDWIGSIPENWEVVKIGSLFICRNEKVNDTDYPPLSVSKGGIVPQIETVAKSDANGNRKLVLKDDFVINSRSDRKQSCGLSQLDGSVSIINTVLTISNKNTLLPIYTNYLLKNYCFAEEFYRWGHGIVADLWTTRWQKMKSIALPIPPHDEQKKIADHLDNKCGEIDRLISLKQQKIDALTSYKKSLIYEYVTGKKEVM